MTLENIIIHQKDHEAFPHHMTCTESWWNSVSGQLKYWNNWIIELKYKINVYPQRDLKGDKNGKGPSNRVLIWVAVLPFPGFHPGKGDSALPGCGLPPDAKGWMKNYSSPEAAAKYFSGRSITTETRGVIVCYMHCWYGCVWTPWSQVHQHVL